MWFAPCIPLLVIATISNHHFLTLSYLNPYPLYIYRYSQLFLLTILIIVPINYVIPMIFPEYIMNYDVPSIYIYDIPCYYPPCISMWCFSGNCLLQLLRLRPLRPLREPLRAPAVQRRRRRAQPEVLGEAPQAPRQERQAQVIAQATGETQHRDDLISRKS